MNQKQKTMLKRIVAAAIVYIAAAAAKNAVNAAADADGINNAVQNGQAAIAFAQAKAVNRLPARFPT